MHTVPKVFISYRRADTAGYAGRLYDILSAQFGRNNTYMDLDTIVGGDDFTAVIEEKISASDALVAVIGDRWLTIAEENGSRRLDNPRDFVRIEVAKALFDQAEKFLKAFLTWNQTPFRKTHELGELATTALHSLGCGLPGLTGRR